jgi:hypothetical protein
MSAVVVLLIGEDVVAGGVGGAHGSSPRAAGAEGDGGASTSASFKHARSGREMAGGGASMVRGTKVLAEDEGRSELMPSRAARSTLGAGCATG